jgi:hypothetical protein
MLRPSDYRKNIHISFTNIFGENIASCQRLPFLFQHVIDDAALEARCKAIDWVERRGTAWSFKPKTSRSRETLLASLKSRVVFLQGPLIGASLLVLAGSEKVSHPPCSGLDLQR